eukprot:1161653-Pelagomonas_calceolata.AAC.10
MAGFVKWCKDNHVREAYRKKGWGLVMAGFIEQCKDDHYLETIEQQKGEGCRMFGHLQVNKVVSCLRVDIV